MGKVYKKLVESFGYIAEAEPGQRPGGIAFNQDAGTTSGQAAPADTSPGKNPNSGSSYTGDIGDAPNDPAAVAQNKPKPKKNPYYSKAIYAVQNMFNALGITDNAGKPIAKDGVWGWRTEEAKWNFFAKYPANSAESSQYDSFAAQVPKDLQWRIVPDRGTGRTARMGPDKAGKKDTQIGSPSPEAAKSMGISLTPPPGDAAQQSAPPADAPKDQPYWVNGTRYEYTSGRGGGSWRPTFKPGDWGLNANQAAAKAGYTGPDSKKSDPQAQGTQIAGAAPGVINKESTELDIIRKLSGM